MYTCKVQEGQWHEGKTKKKTEHDNKHTNLRQPNIIKINANSIRNVDKYLKAFGYDQHVTTAVLNTHTLLHTCPIVSVLKPLQRKSYMAAGPEWISAFSSTEWALQPVQGAGNGSRSSMMH